MTLDLGALAGVLRAANLPALAEALAPAIGAAIGGPGGAVAGKVLADIAAALGTPADPAVIARTIQADTAKAQAALADLNAKQAYALDLFKEGNRATEADAQRQVELYKALPPTLFNAGWRPAFGWSVVAWASLINLYAGVQVERGAWSAASFMQNVWTPEWAVFAAMMGLRSFEKWSGVATKAFAGSRSPGP